MAAPDELNPDSMSKYYQFEQFQFSLQLHTCSVEYIPNAIAIAANLGMRISEKSITASMPEPTDGDRCQR